MIRSGSVIGKITEELGEVGKQVVRESAKVPKDIAGRALESLGASSRQKSSGAGSRFAGQGQSEPKCPFSEFKETKDQKIKQAIARAALEQIAGIYQKKQKEPSVWEKIQMEVEQKKQMAAKQQQQAKKMQLPKMWQKPKKGQLWLSATQKAGSETSRNVRQD